jgi:hypothetical protein
LRVPDRLDGAPEPLVHETVFVPATRHLGREDRGILTLRVFSPNRGDDARAREDPFLEEESVDAPE